MATETEAVTDIESAMAHMTAPQEVEDTQEIEEEATTEEDEEIHSEETEAELETEAEAEESEEAEDESETEEHEEDSEEETPELHTVTVDGEQREVPLDELKRGYSGQQYVQKGMQEAATAKKEAEQVFAQLQEERQHISQMVQLLESGQLASPPIEPDKAQYESDPLAYIEAKLQYDEDYATYQEKTGVLRSQMQQQSAAQAKAQEKYLEQEFMQLKAVEPDFNDPQKAVAIRTSMNKVGEEVYGYKPEELASIADHRAIRVLRDAVRWQELQQTKTQKREKTVKKVAKRGKRKPVTNADSQRRKQRDRARQSGKIEDFVGLMVENG